MPNQIKISRYWENTFFVIYNLVTLDGGGDTWFSLTTFWYILYSLWKYVYFLYFTLVILKYLKLHIFSVVNNSQWNFHVNIFAFFCFSYWENFFLWNTGICQERKRQMTLGWRLWWCWLAFELLLKNATRKFCVKEISIYELVVFVCLETSAV